MSKSTVKIESNVDEFYKEFDKKKEAMLYAIGLKWQEIATKVITLKIYSSDKPWPLTGRLRASLSFITEKQEGPTTSVAASESDNWLNGSANKDELIVGTNVVYSEKVNRKHKFMEDSLLEYKDSYKKVAETIMKQ